MEWLETGLAFAITMMIFSTMVSVIIETGHRILRIREKGLQRIMTQIYKKVIWPRLSNRLDAKTASPEDFKVHMTSSRYLQVDRGVIFLKTCISKFVNANQLTSLSTLEFIERLAETPAGRSLMNEAQRRGEHGREYIETFIKDLASKYEDFGKDATEYFRRRARLMSIVVAIVLAFSLNVNAIHLFRTFLMDKSVREAMISQGDAVAERLQKQEAELKKLLKEKATDQDKNLKKINKNIQDLRDTAKTLSASGIPIGWDTAPWKTANWVKLKDTNDKTRCFIINSLIFLSWIGSVLLAGLLIGLGGPFWFDMFRKLSALTGIFRGLQTPVQKTQQPEQPARGKSRDDSDLKQDLVEIFETAAKANALGYFGGRALLTPEGNIDQGGIL